MNMSGEETHNGFIDRAGRFLSGEMQPEELVAFEEELRTDPDKQREFDEYRKIWNSASPEPGYDLDAEWSLLRNRLPGFDPVLEPEKGGRGPGRSLSYYVYRVAAVLVVGLALTFSWYYVTRMRGMVQVIARENPVELYLEDGTQVVLNRNSRLRYSKTFEQEERTVFLSGEAWFDVTRDTAMPFIIDAGEAMVRVLGTSFNVNAYKDNPAVEITVQSGLVAMSSKEDAGDQIVMKAGSGGVYHKSQKSLQLIPTSDPNSISWRTRELFFQGSTLRDVVELLNRVYDVNLVIGNPELANCPITVTFRDQSLESVLNVLEQTLDLKVTRTRKEIRLDGEGCEE